MERPQAVTRLLCFPAAGASAMKYLAWQHQLPESIDVIGLQPPGRGRRIQEPPFQHMRPLIAAARAAVHGYLDRPFALFGYSAGALMAFELACVLQAGGTGASHLFVAAFRAPHINPERPPIHALPDADFLDQLKGMGGTPAEVLDHGELMAQLLPTLRADFAVAETYHPADGAVLECPITAFGGLRDPLVPPKKLGAWRTRTSAQFQQHLIPGDHFFLLDAEDQVLSVIEQSLAGG